MNATDDDAPWTALVAIPVRDEEALIVPCLEALEAQCGARIGLAVVLANNCTDATCARVREAARRLDLPIELHERRFDDAVACAGLARRAALDLCVAHARRAGLPDHRVLLLTTDADGRVPEGWVARNVAAIERGADAVCGRSGLDVAGHASIPPALHEADAREAAFDALLDRIDASLDPDPADPVPRHTEASGASLAVTLPAYLACGGMPTVRLGEDRAFVEALRRIDARIRHEPSIVVEVSARTEGRAAGGMADTIRRRLVTLDDTLDDRLEPARDRARRARFRAEIRALPAAAAAEPRDGLADALGLAPGRLAAILGEPGFGARWAAIEAESPVLRRTTVAVSRLAAEMVEAAEILAVQPPPTPPKRSIRYEDERRTGTASPPNAAANRTAASSPPSAVPVSPR